MRGEIKDDLTGAIHWAERVAPGFNKRLFRPDDAKKLCATLGVVIYGSNSRQMAVVYRDVLYISHHYADDSPEFVYMVMHEVGHYAMGHFVQGYTHEGELDADAFASLALMPSPMYCSRADVRCGVAIDDYPFYAWAGRIGIESAEVMHRFTQGRKRAAVRHEALQWQYDQHEKMVRSFPESGSLNTGHTEEKGSNLAVLSPALRQRLDTVSNFFDERTPQSSHRPTPQ